MLSLPPILSLSSSSDYFLGIFRLPIVAVAQGVISRVFCTASYVPCRCVFLSAGFPTVFRGLARRCHHGIFQLALSSSNLQRFLSFHFHSIPTVISYLYLCRLLLGAVSYPSCNPMVPPAACSRVELTFFFIHTYSTCTKSSAAKSYIIFHYFS